MSRRVKRPTTVFTCDYCGESKELQGDNYPDCSGFPRPGLDAGWSSVAYAVEEREVPVSITDSSFTWTTECLHFCSWKHMMFYARDHYMVISSDGSAEEDDT